MMKATVPSPDLMLARRAARADPQAWDEIVSRHGERIYNLAFSFAGDAAEAEDLTQEIFLRLYRHLRQYRGEVPLIAWALKISRNLCIDHYRRHRLRLQSETVSPDILEILPAADNPQSHTESREQLRLVYRVLAEMPEILASVLVLRDLQDLSYDEIAAFLEVPTGTVKSRLNRARRELVLRLEQRFDTGATSASSPNLEQVPPPC